MDSALKTIKFKNFGATLLTAARITCNLPTLMGRNNGPILHFDIFQSYIIPDILSQHIHSLLIDQEEPSWHPFFVLPLVCRTFNQTCESLTTKIFGIDLSTANA